MNLFRFTAILAVLSAATLLSAGPQQLPIKRNYPAPQKVDVKEISKVSSAGVPRNIIFIIGDGMGQASIDLASLYAHGAKDQLVLDQFPVTGLAMTFSANSKVTDSAASGTALSSGYKTNNGMIGMMPDKTSRKSIATLAQESGRSVGIMTTDQLTGATPSAFLAHAEHRSKSETIALQESESKADILIGAGRKNFLPKSKNGARTDEKDLTANMKTAGYLEIKTPEDLKKAAAGQKIFGFVENWSQTKLLSTFAEAAMEHLNKNPKGFFMMIEGSYPDGGGHSNNPDTSINGVLMVDFTAKAAMEFAMKHPDTLVVITADHETGGIAVAPNPKQPKSPIFCYTTKSHTGTPVRVFAFGAGAEKFMGLLDNTEIPLTFADFWKLELKK